jgi:hypothetical protein
MAILNSLPTSTIESFGLIDATGPTVSILVKEAEGTLPAMFR